MSTKCIGTVVFRARPLRKSSRRARQLPKSMPSGDGSVPTCKWPRVQLCTGWRNMAKKPDAKAFLAAMGAAADNEQASVKPEAPPARVAVPATEVHTKPKPADKVKPRRAELKHFGGYLDDDTLEK